MKKVLILSMILFATSSTYAWEVPMNPDRFPSVGLRFNNMKLDGDRVETAFNSVNEGVPYRFTDDTEYSYQLGGDVRLPVSRGATITLSYDHIDSEDYFTRKTPDGMDLYKEHKRLSGYSYGIGIRLYLNK